MSNNRVPAIGIDLGTTYSCVAVMQNGKVEIIANDQGNRTTPSYVAFTETERLIGDGAKNQSAQNPTNTVFDAKRLIGRKFNDRTVQTDMKHFPFKVVEGSNGNPEIEVIYKNESKRLKPEEISAAVLVKMKQIAESYLGQTVTDAVITVPAYFNDAQRQSTKDAGAIAGLNVLRIINEPTSAAIAYKLQQPNDSEKNILIFDLGGGTFDISVLNIDTLGSIEVKSTAGDTHLGGEDFDNFVVNHFVSEFKMKKGIDITQNKRAMRRLRTACESAKRTLSSSNTANINIDSLADGVDFDSVLTRAKFEQLCDSKFKECMAPIDDALRVAKLSKSQIDEVVLVGGSTRIPKIKELLSNYFNGKQLCCSINPDEAVAYGAAVQAAILTGDINESNDLVICDAVPISLGLAEGQPVFVNGKMDRKFHTIIKRGGQIPTRATEMFSTGIDNQSEVKIEVYEGERQFVSGNNLLGSFMVSGIPPMRRGEPQIEVTFDIDQNSILNVSAVEKSTGKSNKITIANESGRLSKDDVDRMIKEAEKYAEDDKKALELAEAKNKLENFIYGYRSKLNDEKIKANLTEEETKTINNALDMGNQWMTQNFSEQNKELYEQKLKELEQIVLPFASKMYGSDGVPDMSNIPGMNGMGGFPGMENMNMEELQKMMAEMQQNGQFNRTNNETNGDDELDELDESEPKVEEVD